MMSTMPSEQMGMPEQQMSNGKCCDHTNAADSSLNESLPATDSSKSGSATSSAQNSPSRRSRSGHFKQRRHSHNMIDHTLMGGFYEASMTKLQEVYPQWHMNWQLKSEPIMMSQKQMVFDMMRKYVTECKEPVVLLPNFDYSDVLNFERFLQALKVDGINAISKYKQYLNNKDMKKLDIDLCVIHAKYGVLLFEVRECDHLDNKRRGKAKSQLNSARSCLENLIKLIVDAKGLPHDTMVPVTEFIVLPNMEERPSIQSSSSGRQPMTQKAAMNANLRSVNYLIKQDLQCPESFGKWWSQYVAGRVEQWPSVDCNVLNYFMSVLSGVRNNTLLPVVHQEVKQCDMDMKKENGEAKEQMSFNICAEFFHDAHERVRGLSKCVLSSKDADKVRRTTCLQTLWMLLNDPSKKVSVVCSEKNKQYYEEYFARQRKLYSNLNNVRFYTNLKNCGIDENNTVNKKDSDIWFFDCHVDELTKEVIERIENLRAFWVFVHGEVSDEWKTDLGRLNVRYVDLDWVMQGHEMAIDKKPWLSGLHLKLPLRLSCDLLVIGDIVSQSQLKVLQGYFKSASQQQQQQHHHGKHGGEMQSMAAKKLKSIKFIRGGSIENLRQSIKMHDSIQAQFVLLHVGDEDVFKTKNSMKTIERVKELAAMVKEMCPKSYVILSTLMRRSSKSENTVTNEVNKGIINFCKQTRESSNFFYMLNNHFDPEYHTYEGRSLSNKGLRLYVDNILFVVDYFLVKQNNGSGKQQQQHHQQHQPQPQQQQQPQQQH